MAYDLPSLNLWGCCGAFPRMDVISYINTSSRPHSFNAISNTPPPPRIYIIPLSASLTIIKLKDATPTPKLHTLPCYRLLPPPSKHNSSRPCPCMHSRRRDNRTAPRKEPRNSRFHRPREESTRCYKRFGGAIIDQ